MNREENITSFLEGLVSIALALSIGETIMADIENKKRSFKGCLQIFSMNLAWYIPQYNWLLDKIEALKSRKKE